MTLLILLSSLLYSFWATWQDIQTRKINNLLTLCFFLLSIVFIILHPFVFVFPLFISCLICFLLYAFNVLGAGDSKMLIVLFCFGAHFPGYPLLLTVHIGILYVFYVIFRVCFPLAHLKILAQAYTYYMKKLTVSYLFKKFIQSLLFVTALTLLITQLSYVYTYILILLLMYTIEQLLDVYSLFIYLLALFFMFLFFSLNIFHMLFATLIVITIYFIIKPFEHAFDNIASTTVLISKNIIHKLTARTVLNKQRNVLAPKGTTITPQLLSLFQKQNIHTITIKNEIPFSPFILLANFIIIIHYLM